MQRYSNDSNFNCSFLACGSFSLLSFNWILEFLIYVHVAMKENMLGSSEVQCLMVHGFSLPVYFIFLQCVVHVGIICRMIMLQHFVISMSSLLLVDCVLSCCPISYC